MDNRTMATIQADPGLRVTYTLRVTLAVCFLITLFAILIAVLPVGDRTALWLVFAITATSMVIFTALYLCSVLLLKPSAGATRVFGARIAPRAPWAHGQQQHPQALSTNVGAAGPGQRPVPMSPTSVARMYRSASSTGDSSSWQTSQSGGVWIADGHAERFGDEGNRGSADDSSDGNAASSEPRSTAVSFAPTVIRVRVGGEHAARGSDEVIEVNTVGGEVRRKPRRGKKSHGGGGSKKTAKDVGAWSKEERALQKHMRYMKEGGKEGRKATANLKRSKSAHAGLGGGARSRIRGDDGYEGKTTAVFRRSTAYPTKAGGGGAGGASTESGGSQSQPSHTTQAPRRASTMSVLTGSSMESDFEMAQRLQHEEDMAAARHHDESKAAAAASAAVLRGGRDGGSGSGNGGVNGGNINTTRTISPTSPLPSREPVTADGEDVCCICLDDISVGGNATTLRCAHTFHQRCITKWFKSQGIADEAGVTSARKCPMCNQSQ